MAAGRVPQTITAVLILHDIARLTSSGQVVKKFQGGWWIYHNGRLVPVVRDARVRDARSSIISYGYEISVDNSTDNPVLYLLINSSKTYSLFYIFSGASADDRYTSHTYIAKHTNK